MRRVRARLNPRVAILVVGHVSFALIRYIQTACRRRCGRGQAGIAVVTDAGMGVGVGLGVGMGVGADVSEGGEWREGVGAEEDPWGSVFGRLERDGAGDGEGLRGGKLCVYSMSPESWSGRMCAAVLSFCARLDGGMIMLRMRGEVNTIVG